MQIDVKYHHIESSRELTEWTLEKLKRAATSKLHPSSIGVTYSKEGRVPRVEVHMHAFAMDFSAHAEGPSFQKAFDAALQRLLKQVQRKKGKVQAYQPAPMLKAG